MPSRMRLAGMLVACALLTGCASSPAVNAETSATGDLTIDAGDLAEGSVAFVPFGDEGTAQVLVARTPNGLAVKLDTCNSCNGAPQAYYLPDGKGSIVCQNCGFTFALDELDAGQGSCRPLDVAHATEGNRVTIAADDLRAAEPLFAAIRR